MAGDTAQCHGLWKRDYTWTRCVQSRRRMSGADRSNGFSVATKRKHPRLTATWPGGEGRQEAKNIGFGTGHQVRWIISADERWGSIVQALKRRGVNRRLKRSKNGLWLAHCQAARSRTAGETTGTFRCLFAVIPRWRTADEHVASMTRESQIQETTVGVKRHFP